MLRINIIHCQRYCNCFTLTDQFVFLIQKDRALIMHNYTCMKKSKVVIFVLQKIMEIVTTLEFDMLNNGYI